MKKTLSLVLALVMALALVVFAGCGQPGGGETPAADVDSLQTVGDAIALAEAQMMQNTEWATYDDTLIYAFQVGDNMYRVFATLPADVSEAYNALDFGDPDFDAKWSELVAPLPIDRCEDLTALIPAQEELDKLVGQTGGDLLDDDWYVCYYEPGKPECSMNHGMFTYKVVFDGELPAGDIDPDEAVAPLTVRSVTYERIGDATYLEYEGVPAVEKNMSTEDAQQAVETAMQYLLEEAYGDQVIDARIVEVTVYTAEEEQLDELLRSYQLGPDEYAFSVHYELLPAEGADPIMLTAGTGEIDEATGWVVEKYNVGVLRPNEAGSDPAYVITDFGTGF